MKCIRIFWAIALLVFLSSCTSYKYAVLPGTPVDGGENRDVQEIHPTAKVRVTLNNGKTVKGEVLRANGQQLVLGRAGNYGMEEKVITASEISRIEVEYTTPGGKIAVITFVALTALVIYGLADLSRNPISEF